MSKQFSSRSIGQSASHESAAYHVCGNAPYVDDIKAPEGTLYVAFSLSKIAYGKINQVNTSKAKKAPGVRSILLAEDIEHLNIGPVRQDEPLLAKDYVLFYGQAVCAVLANSFENARKAAAMVEMDISKLEAIVTIEQAMDKKSFLDKPLVIETGDYRKNIKKDKHYLQNNISIGGQEHFYLESQIALAIPTEQDEMIIHSSTQNPSEIQHLVAHVLKIPQHSVEILTRRMGGGFGGKETDSSQIACICALFARQTKQAVKARLPRYEDFLMTGKRHDYLVDYQVSFNDEGLISAINIEFAARCGYSLDLSEAIVYRTLFHADNCYYLPNARFCGHLCKTNTVSNTAFRGFGGPQGMLAIESIIEDIANTLKKDPLTVRQLNFYQQNSKNTTPYGQTIEDNIISELSNELIQSSDYHQRREKINQFNQQHQYLKKGLAFSPVKFGISFTTIFLNQAGALVNIYKDGSIYLNHGGTEMGQGLFIKVAQIVANEFGVEVDRIKVSATSTAKIPNTSATAASSGSDLNGMAAFEACRRIKQNLLDFVVEQFDAKAKEVTFENNKVCWPQKTIEFNELIAQAYLNRVELFSNGFYKTPKIHYDRETQKGRPFYYYAYGVSVSEVVIDLLTGEHKLLATDILHDAGASINPAIDKGQIVGGFIQGMGWLCTEELKWNNEGNLITTGAATYKIPAIGDTPRRFNVTIQPNISNHEDTVYKSKAVGEPPLMLAISVWLAIKNAIFNAGGKSAQLNAPASFEQVFFCLHNKIK